MANETDIQTKTGTIVVGFSTNSTVGELIDGIRALRNKPEENEEKKSLIEAIKFILKTFDVKINILNWEEVTEFLKKFSENETIAKITEEKIGKPEVLQSDLNKMRLDELVEAYEKAKSNDERNLVAEIIARYENIKIGQVEQFIKIQKELYKIDIEKISKKTEKGYIKQIQKEIKVGEPEAKDIWRDIKVEIASDKVNQLLDKTTNLYQDPNIKKIVSHSVEDFILGVTTKVEGLENTMEGQEIKKIEVEAERFVEENEEAVRYLKLEEVIGEFKVSAANAPTKEDSLEVQQFEIMIKRFLDVKTPNLQEVRNETQHEIEKTIHGEGKQINVLGNVEVVVKAAYQTPKKFQEIFAQYAHTRINSNLLPKIPEVRSFQELMAVVDKNPKVMMGLQKMVNSKIKMIEWVSKLPGMGGLSETIGGVAMKEFMAGAMKVMAEKGMLTGAKAILQGIIAGSAATAEASGASAAAVTVAGLFSALPPLAIVIIVMMIAIEVIKFAYKIYDTLAGWIHGATGINFLWGARDFIAGIFGGGKFGRFVGTIGQIGINAMIGAGVFIGVLFGPMLAMGLAAMTAVIAPVVIGLAGGMLVYNLLVTQPMISSLVPPPPQGLGGTCWPKGGEEESGKINCNQDAPKVSAKMSKDDFADLASRWVGNEGQSHVEECYYDAVNRSLCAGIDPNYTLAIWLHESGASNYELESRPNIEDFGIHGSQSVPTENFDLQIKYFLTLDMGPHCPNLPYWLSVSTNFLTGGCDPDLQNDIYPITGRMYYEELQATYNLLTGSSLPATIHVKPGGSQCRGIAGEKPNEYTRPDGVLMECDGPVDENGNFIGNPGGVDPDSSGKPGEPIAGVSCSVAEHVKSTKQCGESWSNMGLPGGSGTICSAGCGPSSVSSILRPINGGWTPNTVIFEAGSPYSNMGGEGSSLGDARDSLINHGFGGKVGQVQLCSTDDVSNWIRQGQAVILLTNSYTGSSGGTIGHILVAVGIDDAGVIYTKDPYYSNETPFPLLGEGIEAGQIKDLRQCLPVDIGEPCLN